MDERIDTIQKILAHSPSSGRALEDLAKSMNLSLSRVRHLFRREVGVSPGQFLKGVRLERAKTLLETSYLSIKQIMFEAGYADETRFIRVFRKTFGHTPGEYRHLVRTRSMTSGARHL